MNRTGILLLCLLLGLTLLGCVGENNTPVKKDTSENKIPIIGKTFDKDAYVGRDSKLKFKDIKPELHHINKSRIYMSAKGYTKKCYLTDFKVLIENTGDYPAYFRPTNDFSVYNKYYGWCNIKLNVNGKTVNSTSWTICPRFSKHYTILPGEEKWLKILVSNPTYNTITGWIHNGSTFTVSINFTVNKSYGQSGEIIPPGGPVKADAFIGEITKTVKASCPSSQRGSK